MTHIMFSSQTNEWLTPPSIITSLGKFDLDPSAPIDRPWGTAKVHYTRLDDGLTKPWFGRVWLNPPFSYPIVKMFMKKMVAHGNGIMLLPFRPHRKVWAQFVWPHFSGIFIFEKPLRFHYPNGEASKHNAPFPTALIAFGDSNVEALRQSGLSGYLITQAVRFPLEVPLSIAA